MVRYLVARGINVDVCEVHAFSDFLHPDYIVRVEGQAAKNT